MSLLFFFSPVFFPFFEGCVSAFLFLFLPTNVEHSLPFCFSPGHSLWGFQHTHVDCFYLGFRNGRLRGVHNWLKVTSLVHASVCSILIRTIKVMPMEGLSWCRSLSCSPADARIQVPVLFSVALWIDDFSLIWRLWKWPFKDCLLPGMVVPIWNLGTWEAEARWLP